MLPPVSDTKWSAKENIDDTTYLVATQHFSQAAEISSGDHAVTTDDNLGEKWV